MNPEIEALAALPLSQLRDEWHRWHQERPMPDRLPRDLLVRTIAWRIQEEPLGSKTMRLFRKLERLSAQLARSGTLDLERLFSLKPGTRLLREWHGKTYRVTALEDGWLYDDRRFVSLSQIAREITGTRWSGPRFFGLKPVVSAGGRRATGND